MMEYTSEVLDEMIQDTRYGFVWNVQCLYVSSSNKVGNA